MLKERCCRGWGGGLRPREVLLPGPSPSHSCFWACTRSLGLAELMTRGTTGNWGELTRGDDDETGRFGTAVLSRWDAGAAVAAATSAEAASAT